MKVVHRFPLYFGKNVIKVRRLAKVLKAGIKPDGTMNLWIESIVIGQGNEDRIFYIYGTGDTIPENLQHVETFLQEEFVWHVYEEV